LDALAAVVAWAWAALPATAEVVVAGEEEEKEDEEKEEDMTPDFKYFHQPPVIDLLFGRA
jgi:hypothetical protein